MSEASGVGRAVELLSEIVAWQVLGVDWEESGSNQDDPMQLTGQLHSIVMNYRVEVDEGRVRREVVWLKRMTLPTARRLRLQSK
jgi:hypothetical protein